MARPTSKRPHGSPRVDPIDARKADHDRLVTIGAIAKAHGVTPHEAAQALPMTPRHGAFPFNPAPVQSRDVRPPTVTLTRPEADALLGECERLCRMAGDYPFEQRGSRGDSVLLSALRKLGRVA